jgi:hypothetical protein
VLDAGDNAPASSRSSATTYPPLPEISSSTHGSESGVKAERHSVGIPVL